MRLLKHCPGRGRGLRFILGLTRSAAGNLRLGSAACTAEAAWVAPNKPIWRLSELLAKHKGQPNWSQTVVR